MKKKTLVVIAITMLITVVSLFVPQPTPALTSVNLKNIQTDKITHYQTLAGCWWCGCWVVEPGYNAKTKAEYIKLAAAF